MPSRQPNSTFWMFPADQLAILQGQPQDPLPYGPVAESGLIEERRELLGTVDQSSLCQKWHNLARASCFAGDASGVSRGRTSDRAAAQSKITPHIGS